MDIDYAHRIHTYLFGLINVEKILNRNDAIKAKWITGVGVDTLDIEMKGTGGLDDAFVVQNPMTETESLRISVTFTFVCIIYRE